MVAGVGYAAGRHGANRANEEQAQNQQIAELQAQQTAQPAPAPAAAPAATSTDDMVEELTKLKGLLDAGVLTQQEFDAQKAKILNGWSVPAAATTTLDPRLQRKQHNRLDTGRGSTWWAPGAIAWWIGVLFMVGALCFALGPLPAYAELVGDRADDVTFFVGSIFFTAAAFLQYLEAANALPPDAGDRELRRVRVLTWEPRRIDWWATSVQLVGTLAFNASTFAALDRNLGVAEVDRLVWRPDAVGSVCFLGASTLAWVEVARGWWAWSPRRLSWWIALLNLGGSIAFGVSAVASYVSPASGQPRNLTLTNAGTLVGALGFLVGALLLLPERTTVPAPTPASRTRGARDGAAPQDP
jgi:hypothetical protein